MSESDMETSQRLVRRLGRVAKRQANEIKKNLLRQNPELIADRMTVEIVIEARSAPGAGWDVFVRQEE